MKNKIEKCADCGNKMIEKIETDINSVPYRYWSCEKCGREVLDMGQLHQTATIYKKLKNAYPAKVSKWGTSLAVRIPKKIISEQKIKEGDRFRFLKEKNGIRLVQDKD